MKDLMQERMRLLELMLRIDRLHLSLKPVAALIGASPPAAERGEGETDGENDMRPHVW